MGTGLRSTFVISWSQTEVDGIAPDAIGQISAGATWRWHGDVARVDGPAELPRLEKTDRQETDRARAAGTVRRLLAAPFEGTGDRSATQAVLVVTDGTGCYTANVIEPEPGMPPLLVFSDAIPPRDTEMRVVHHAPETGQGIDAGSASAGVMCFTPGTLIETPDGPRLVEDLREGDSVQTRDNGAEEIQWIGSRRMTGARLFAMPHLRPVHIRADALGGGRPEADLLVSPEHRILVRGDIARALFNTPEAVVAARDLVNSGSIKVDMAEREVTYIHVLLPRPQIVCANGLETESVHPASAAMSSLGDEDRLRLLERVPEMGISRPEAANLAHETA